MGPNKRAWIPGHSKIPLGCAGVLGNQGLDFLQTREAQSREGTWARKLGPVGWAGGYPRNRCWPPGGDYDRSLRKTLGKPSSTNGPIRPGKTPREIFIAHFPGDCPRGSPGEKTFGGAFNSRGRFNPGFWEFLGTPWREFPRDIHGNRLGNTVCDGTSPGRGAQGWLNPRGENPERNIGCYVFIAFVGCTRFDAKGGAPPLEEMKRRRRTHSEIGCYKRNITQGVTQGRKRDKSVNKETAASTKQQQKSSQRRNANNNQRREKRRGW